MTLYKAFEKGFVSPLLVDLWKKRNHGCPLTSARNRFVAQVMMCSAAIYADLVVACIAPSHIIFIISLSLIVFCCGFVLVGKVEGKFIADAKALRAQCFMSAHMGEGELKKSARDCLKSFARTILHSQKCAESSFGESTHTWNENAKQETVWLGRNYDVFLNFSLVPANDYGFAFDEAKADTAREAALWEADRRKREGGTLELIVQ